MSEKTLHRWVLLDKKGKNRGTVTASGLTQARNGFRFKRGGVPVPPGWTIVDRGPVTEATPKEAQPRAFKVGDRVRSEEKYWNLYGKAGTIHPGTRGYLFDIVYDEDPKQYRWGYNILEGSIVHLDDAPAPEPKAEDGERDLRRSILCKIPAGELEDLKTSVAALGVSQARVKVLEAQAIGWQEDLNAKDAEIATLKAEVDRLTTERNTALCGADLLKASRDGLQEALDTTMRRAEAAEAKLADIAVLLRALILMGDTESFQEAMSKVLAA